MADATVKPGATFEQEPPEPVNPEQVRNLMHSAFQNQVRDVVVHGIGDLAESLQTESGLGKVFEEYGEISQILIRHRASGVASPEAKGAREDVGSDPEGNKTKAPATPATSPSGTAQAAAVKAFRAYDKDSSGDIDRKEMRDLMSGIGLHLGRTELDEAIDSMDPNGDNKISFSEFEQWYGSGMQMTDTSYAVVSYKDPASTRVCLEAHAAGQLPPELDVQLFDHARAARSEGKMNKIVAELKEVEFEEFHLREGFQPSSIFSTLEKDADLKLLQTDLVPHRLQDFLAYAVSPKDPWRMRWDVGVLAVVVWSCLFVPYNAAYRPDGVPGWKDLLIDLIFWTDIVLNFFTGYDKGYEVIMDKGKIVRHYLKGWFLLDLIATVDWEVVGAKLVMDEDAEMPMFVRMLALIKVTRLLRASRLIDNITADWTTNSGLIEALKFSVYVTVVAHLLACFFSLVPMFVESSSECAEDKDLTAQVEACIKSVTSSTPLGDPEVCGDRSPSDGVGWYYPGQCRQNSWLQQAGLEAICIPKLCAEKEEGKPYDMNYDLRNYEDLGEGCYDFTEGFLGVGYTQTRRKDAAGEDVVPWEMTKEEEADFLWRTYVTVHTPLTKSDANYQKAPLCQAPYRRYVDAVYWSLTTMTTIGYGDRGPSSEPEIIYTCFAEVFGLAFFALLLTQIDHVAVIINMESQAIRDDKDGVLQFLKTRRLKSNLVESVVRFMNFRSNALSGNAYDERDPRFKYLSPRLKARIREAVYLPRLKKVCFFGWDEQEDSEEDMVRGMFDQIDTDGSGFLDRQEILALFKTLNIELEGEQFQSCYDELDKQNNGHVSFPEFSWWWFLTKYGVPRISSGVRCPMDFLTSLCQYVRPHAYGIGERIVQPQQYGDHFAVLQQGLLRILRPGAPPGQPGSSPDDKERIKNRDILITPIDREPIFGFSACLTKPQFDYVKLRTDLWAIDAEEYSDALLVSRKDFYRCFSEHWPSGRDDMVVWSYYHYDIGAIINSKSGMDTDGDGIVDKDEFIAAGKIAMTTPHGFDRFYHEETTKPGPIARPKRIEDESIPSTPDINLETGGVQLGFWGTDNSDPKSELPETTKQDADGLYGLYGLYGDEAFQAAHLQTEADFVDEEVEMNDRLQRMEMTVDSLAAELDGVRGCVKTVLDHFDVKETEQEDFANTKRETTDLVAQLKLELMEKDAQIKALQSALGGNASLGYEYM